MAGFHMTPEQLQLESFSVSCSDVCNSPSISSDVKSACDAGSYQYCHQQDNISTDQCISFVDRVVRTRAAERTNAVYANPVNIGTPRQELDNMIFNDAIEYVGRNVGSTDQTVVNRIVGVLTPEPDMLAALTVASIRTCDESQSAACSFKPWIADGVKQLATLIVNDMKIKDRGLDYILTTVPISMISMYDEYLVQYYDFALSNITVDLIAYPKLLNHLRANSAYIRNRLDLIILNRIFGNSLTTIPLNKDGSYNIDVSGKAGLYEPIVRAYYNGCAAISTTDQFVLAVANADIINIARCASIDPTKDTTCIAMKATGDPTLSSAVDASMKTYCMNSANIGSDSCSAYVNKLMSTDPAIDKNVIFNLVLTAATNKDGSLNKTTISKFNGMVDWLLVKTADSITTDANGNKIISSTCGTSTGLTTDQCKQVCAAYPELCVNDQADRCKMPMYRYAETFEVLAPTTKESFGDTTSDIWLYILIFIIVCLGFFFIRKYRMRRDVSNAHQEVIASLSNII